MLSNNVRRIRRKSIKSNRETVKPKQTGKPPKLTGHARVKNTFQNTMGLITDANQQVRKKVKEVEEKAKNKLNETKAGREVVKAVTGFVGDATRALTGKRAGPKGFIGKRNALRPGHRTWTYAE